MKNGTVSGIHVEKWGKWKVSVGIRKIGDLGGLCIKPSHRVSCMSVRRGGGCTNNSARCFCFLQVVWVKRGWENGLRVRLGISP